MPYTKTPLCVGAIGSMTQALKGVRALQNEGIHAEVVALSAAETKRGCAYGVAFSCESLGVARGILRNASVSVSQYLQRSALP